jgi:hypothetical protein
VDLVKKLNHLFIIYLCEVARSIGTCEIIFEVISVSLLIYYFEAAAKEIPTGPQTSPITTAQSYKFPFHYPFGFHKAIAAMTAAPIIPAPTLKPLPALEVAVAGAEDDAFEAADEATVLAGAVLDEMAAVVAEPEEMAVVTADDALVTTEAAEEPAVDATDAVLDGAEVAVLEPPLARAIEQISLVTLVVAV